MDITSKMISGIIYESGKKHADDVSPRHDND